MNIKTFIVGLGIASTIGFQSCRDDFDFDPVSDDLRFSKDTVSVDTLYNYSRSETYLLKVYNPKNEDLVIPKIYLNRGESSIFKVNVDGKAGASFINTPIRKKDSLFIFIEAHAEEASPNPLYTDELTIETTNSKQQIKLISWVEKAKIHSKDAVISSAQWTENEAQVIDGNLTITSSLHVGKGSKIYFKKGGSLTVAPNAIVQIDGRLGEEVKFRSARHDTKYDSLPNQWNKIELQANVKANINYTKIIGGDIGLHVNEADLTIGNSKIVNNQSYGILATHAKITGHNVVINNSNLAGLAIELGGNYAFYHSTFANYFNFAGTAGPAYSIYLSNVSNDNKSTAALERALFANSIIYNERNENAILFERKEGAEFNFLFDTNIIKNRNTTLYNALTGPGFTNNKIEDPLYNNPSYKVNQLWVTEKSPAKGAGNILYATQYPLDYNGVVRGTSPTLGAYQ